MIAVDLTLLIPQVLAYLSRWIKCPKGHFSLYAFIIAHIAKKVNTIYAILPTLHSPLSVLK